MLLIYNTKSKCEKNNNSKYRYFYHPEPPVCLGIVNLVRENETLDWGSMSNVTGLVGSRIQRLCQEK